MQYEHPPRCRQMPGRQIPDRPVLPLRGDEDAAETDTGPMSAIAPCTQGKQQMEMRVSTS